MRDKMRLAALKLWAIGYALLVSLLILAIYPVILAPRAVAKVWRDEVFTSARVWGFEFWWRPTHWQYWRIAIYGYHPDMVRRYTFRLYLGPVVVTKWARKRKRVAR